MHEVRREAGARIALASMALALSTLAQGADTSPVGGVPSTGNGLRLTSEREAGSSAPAWGERRSYLIPAAEILGFQFLLNQFDRHYFGCCDFDSNAHTISRNWKSSWRVDSDSFTVNQIGHPYQGSMYHGFARASGLGYWTSLGYTFAGSAVWEIAGEATQPSKNDQITTGIGGSFLGETLFRMSNLWLENGPGGKTARELMAAAISPPVGFNRLVFGERFDGIYPSRDPAYYGRLQLGVASATQDHGDTRSERRHEAIVDFALDYGLPGKKDYRYDRPFDYFTFQAAASSAIGLETVTARGLLVGTDYTLGPRYRGIWGLYGGYDYLAPQVFRLASTAVSIGTTAEWRASESLVLQGSVLGGIGYATVSTVHGEDDIRSNNYGVAPQGSISLRLVYADRAAFAVAVRDYLVSRTAKVDGAHDDVVRVDASLTWRVTGRHAVALTYRLSRRAADYPDLEERIASRQTVGIFYTFLGRDGFGSGEWR